MFKKILIGIAIFVLLLPLPTFIHLGDKDSVHEVTVYLVSNDIHVGIMVPRKTPDVDWDEFVLDEAFPQKFPKLEWVEFGWGDRRFYFEMPTWDKFTYELAADALFWPDPAVMHVGLSAPLPESAYVRKIGLTRERYKKLSEAIKDSFILQNGKPILIPGKGYSPVDSFFEAKGSYSLIRTCNVWTSDIFAAAGLRHPLWSPSKYGLEWIWE